MPRAAHSISFWIISTTSLPGPASVTSAHPSDRPVSTYDTAESDVGHSGIDHLRLPRCWPVAQAVVGRAQMRAAFDDLAGNAKLRLARVVALLRRGYARVDRWATAGFDDLVGVAMDVPVASPFPHIAGHVVQPVIVRRERADWGGSLVTINEQILPGELALPGVGHCF